MLTLFKHLHISPKKKTVNTQPEISISAPLSELPLSDVRTYFEQHADEIKFSRKSRFGQTNSWIKTHDGSLYKLDKRLDKGAEGKIKKAFTEQGEQVAAKVVDLNKKYVYTSNEITVLSKLGRLKNIATRKLDENTRRLYIFQEFIHAQTMRQFLYSPFQITTYEQRIIVAINYVKALLTLFEQHGIVHADVKIDNAMVHENLEVTLVDFGFSKILPPGETMLKDIVLTHTPGYAAPEVLNEKCYSPASDIYALGKDFASDFNFPQDMVASMQATLPQDRPSHREILRRLKEALSSQPLSAKGRETIQEVDKILKTPAVVTNYHKAAHPPTFKDWNPAKPSRKP